MKKYICGMIGDGVNDVFVLKKVDIGIVVVDVIDVVRSVLDIVLIELGLSVIISVVFISCVIF